MQNNTKDMETNANNTESGLLDNEHVGGPAFPDQDCPCGAPADDDRLYCDDCIDRMAQEMAEEWG